MPENNQNNNKAILIGLILIALIAILTFSRPYLRSKPDGKSLTDPAKEAAQKQPHGISGADLHKKINDGEKLAVVDIRDPDSFKSEHIVDSKNISIEKLETLIASLDKRATYVFVEASGDKQSSGLVNQFFIPQGFENAKYLSGGFSQWKQEFRPTVSDGDPTVFTDQSKVSYLNSDELNKMIETENNLYIIDVRKASGFADGHIKNSANIFLDDLESKRKEIPMGKKIVVYDKDGLWAMKAAVRLFDMGIFVYALSDGLDGWKTKGFELVK